MRVAARAEVQIAVWMPNRPELVVLWPRVARLHLAADGCLQQFWFRPATTPTLGKPEIHVVWMLGRLTAGP